MPRLTPVGLHRQVPRCPTRQSSTNMQCNGKTIPKSGSRLREFVPEQGPFPDGATICKSGQGTTGARALPTKPSYKLGDIPRPRLSGGRDRFPGSSAVPLIFGWNCFGTLLVVVRIFAGWGDSSLSGSIIPRRTFPLQVRGPPSHLPRPSRGSAEEGEPHRPTDNHRIGLPAASGAQPFHDPFPMKP